MPDIYATKKLYKSKEISSLGFVTSSANLADEKTIMKKQKALYNLLL